MNVFGGIGTGPQDLLTTPPRPRPRFKPPCPGFANRLALDSRPSGLDPSDPSTSIPIHYDAETRLAELRFRRSGSARARRAFRHRHATQTGWRGLTDAEVGRLREYLLRGGLLVVDDFWGPEQWEVLREIMHRVLPGQPIVDIARTDSVMHVL